MTVDAVQAINNLDIDNWITKSIKERIKLLEIIQSNLQNSIEELYLTDLEIKGLSLDDHNNYHQRGLAKYSTIAPFGNNLSTCIEIYKKLESGKLANSFTSKQISSNIYEAYFTPGDFKKKLFYADFSMSLRFSEKPIQINPIDNKCVIIAILGAGNFSSPFEILRALFIENSVVVYKPHPNNVENNRVWEKILEPLVQLKVLSFCEESQGEQLVKDTKISKIYFTGSNHIARTISNSSNAQLISECGGNNPCIIVPGNKPWSKKAIKHHAMQIASFSKFNGGAICGRIQTIVTCKNWTQRKIFLDEVYRALKEATPGTTSYYPGSIEKFELFCKQYPTTTKIHPEKGAIKQSDILFVTDTGEQSYAIHNEAFCQILTEVALDTEPNAEYFLPKAVEFCNKKLWGSLASSIIIDNRTYNKFNLIINQAITNLQYGSIAINTMPLFIWLTPYLSWGGNEDSTRMESGHGHFGNLLCLNNVEKSILRTKFLSKSHLAMTNKRIFSKLLNIMSALSVKMTWTGLIKLIFTVYILKILKKDFLS